MVTSAFVHIWGKRAGAIAWNPQNGVGSFEYDPEFKKNGWDLSPIQIPLKADNKRVFSFPELRDNPTFKGMPGLVADLLPDKYGNALINSWLIRHGRRPNSLNPVETLCFIGKRGIGALEIEPAHPKGDKKSSDIEISELVEIAGKILSNRQNFGVNVSKHEEKVMVDILKIGTSAGGARAKAIIAYNSKTREVRSGQGEIPEGFSHWLIKFDGVIDRQFGSSSGYGRVEMAYYHMATDAGIEMEDCHLLEENGRAHFMTKRFDRNPNGNKIHMQSFCGLRHFDYNDVGLYSYEQLFETMRIFRLPYPQAEQMYRRMVFNVMGRNCDDHTKNFAFLMDKNGIWKLSPAYDVCHAYRPGSEWVSQHSLSLNGKRKEITKKDLLEVAYQMNVKKPKQIIEQIAGVVGSWNNYAEQVEVDRPLKEAIAKTLIIL